MIKMKVYQVCVLSTLLYGSEAWTLHTHQEQRLNAFHMGNLRRLLGITWQDCHLSQRRLHWLGHVCRMDDSRIPKDILYDKLATGIRPTGRSALPYKDVCKRDLKSCNINPADLETATFDSSSWSANVITGIKQAEEKRGTQHEERKSCKQQSTQPITSPAIVPTTVHTCSKCGRSCRSRICLFTHSRRCCPNTKLGCQQIYNQTI